jgi:hypothetical protein
MGSCIGSRGKTVRLISVCPVKYKKGCTACWSSVRPNRAKRYSAFCSSVDTPSGCFPTPSSDGIQASVPFVSFVLQRMSMVNQKHLSNTLSSYSLHRRMHRRRRAVESHVYRKIPSHIDSPRWLGRAISTLYYDPHKYHRRTESSSLPLSSYLLDLGPRPKCRATLVSSRF